MTSKAFAALVEKYQEQIHALAWQKIGDFHIAQESHKMPSSQRIKNFQRSHITTDLREGSMSLPVTSVTCGTERKNRNSSLLKRLTLWELEEVYYSKYVSQQREEAANQNRRSIVRKLLNKLGESERTVVTMHYLQA